MNRKLITAALLAALCSACATSEEETQQPYVRPQGTVKTQFNIAVSDNKATTRMNDDELQWAQTLQAFRGMEDIVVKPFAHHPVAIGDTPLGPDLVLEHMVKPVEYDQQQNYIPAGNSHLLAASHSALYEDVDMPNGTAAILFYGKAIDDPQTDAEKHQYGILTPQGMDGKPADIRLCLNAINPDAHLDEQDIALNIADYLTQIANATDSHGDAWGDTEDLVVGDLYKAFTGTIAGTTNPLAGSSRNAQAVVQELYTSAQENSQLAAFVEDAILNSENSEGVKYVNSVDDTGNLQFNTTLLGNTATTDYYPANVGLPDGAAALAWNDTDQRFAMVTTFSDAMSYTPTLTTTDMAFYVYPPSLYYYANSTVLTSTSEQKDNYTDERTWPQIRALYTDGAAVAAATKSVIMEQQVQYGVGCLEVKVNCASATLKDYDDADISYTAGGFPITAVLVGSQRDAAFDFTPAGAESYTLYDNIMPNAFKATAGTAFTTITPSRTLVMETEENQTVNIAVEFVNNSGHDFYGHQGDLISKGCRFYLVASLDPTTNASYTEQDPENPWADGSALINQVFKQDHVTLAQLTIGDLRNAYNLVPDLRLPKLDLGLLVNLEWQTGIEMGTVNL